MIKRIYALLFILLCLACGENADPAPVKEFRLSEIRNDGAVVKIVYRDDGKVDNIKWIYGDYWSQFVFNYETENVVKANRYTTTDEFAFDRTHIFDYAGDRLVKMRFIVPVADYPEGFMVQYDTIIYNQEGQIAEVHNWTNGSRPDLPIEKLVVAKYQYPSEELRTILYEMRYSVGDPETEVHYNNQPPISDNFFVNFYLLQVFGPIFDYQFPSRNVDKFVMLYNDGHNADEVREYAYTFGENSLPSSRKGPEGTLNFLYEEIIK